MVTKLGKEKSVNLSRNFRLSYGTVDAKKLTAVYLQVQSWVQPLEDNTDYKRSVTYLKNVVYNTINNNLNKDIFRDKFLIDLDLPISGMSEQRRSFMCLEVTLFLNTSVGFKSIELQTQVINLLVKMTEDLQKNKFSFKPTKK